ncbi:hypothetical protein K438DRAFT_1823129, partial [Mycena galopus ATCC 62051]
MFPTRCVEPVRSSFSCPCSSFRLVYPPLTPAIVRLGVLHTPTALARTRPAWGTGPAQTCQVILDILSGCSQLRFLRLTVEEPLDGDLQDSVVQCPSLRTLHILERPESPFDASTLVSSLAASPRLKTISINDPAAFPRPHLIDFLRSLPTTVQHLHITEPWQVRSEDSVLDDDVFAALEA